MPLDTFQRFLGEKLIISKVKSECLFPIKLGKKIKRHSIFCKYHCSNVAVVVLAKAAALTYSKLPSIIKTDLILIKTSQVM